MAAIFQTVLMRLALCGLAASLVLLALRSRLARDTFVRLLSIWRSLTAFGRVAVCSFLLIGVLVGGDKTNNVPPNLNSPLPQMMQGGGSLHLIPHSTSLIPLSNPVQTTNDDISRGWRIESVTTNAEPFAAMPSNAVEYARWSLRGGREMWFPLEFGGFE